MGDHRRYSFFAVRLSCLNLIDRKFCYPNFLSRRKIAVVILLRSMD
jgi:hypothetical protein